MAQITLRESIVVPRPVADCQRYLRDFSTIEQWDPTVLRALKRTPGPVRIGSEFHLELRVFGRRSTMHYQLVEMSGDALRFLGVGPGIEADDRIAFTAESDGTTRIDYEAQLRLSGLGAVGARVLDRALRRMGRKTMEGLRRALSPESVPPPGGTRPDWAQRLLLPAALGFTQRGYRAMPRKAHSVFMDGKTVVITGATGGIGLAAACELARLGATLILVGRGRERLERAAEAVADFAGHPAGIHLVEADLEDARQRGEAVAAIRGLTSRIDVLINNAGALFDVPRLTRDGVERTWAINLLAPFHLTRALLPALRRSRGRVINVSSGGQYLQPLRLDRWADTSPAFDGVKAYAQAKRALVALTRAWARDVPQVGFHAMHPGWVATPGVARSLPAFNRLMRRGLRDARMGADTIVWLSAAPAALLGSGRFWLDREVQPYDVIPGTEVRPAAQARLLELLDHRVPAARSASSSLVSTA